MKLRGLRATVCAVGVVLLVGVMPAVAGASQKKTYKVDLAPETVGFGNQTITAAMTNLSSPGQTFGSARFTAPDGILIRKASVGGQEFVNDPPAPSITLTALGVDPGETETVTLHLSVPTGQCGVFLLTSHVKQSNDFKGAGNDFRLNEAVSDLSMGVVGCALSFAPQPADARVNQSIRATAFEPVTGAPVAVEAADGLEVTMSLRKRVGDGVLKGTIERTSVSGKATFDDLTVDRGGRYQLVATDGEEQVFSEPFYVEEGAVLCQQGGSCSVSVRRGGAASFLATGPEVVLTASIESASSTGYLRAALIPRDDIKPVTLMQETPEDATGCDGYDEQSPFYSRFSGPGSLTVDITVPGADGMQGCYFGPDDNPFLFNPLAARPTIADTDGDGTPEAFSAVVPPCAEIPLTETQLPKPCVSASEGENIQIRVPDNGPIDPGSVP